MSVMFCRQRPVQHLKFIHKLDEFIEHHNDEIEDQDEQNMVICVESADRG